ncbi:2-oxoglutarate ferredoxin oxidoreductase subunit delta, partial [Dysosmobacter welbionis]
QVFFTKNPPFCRAVPEEPPPAGRMQPAAATGSRRSARSATVPGRPEPAPSCPPPSRRCAPRRRDPPAMRPR